MKLMKVQAIKTVLAIFIIALVLPLVAFAKRDYRPHPGYLDEEEIMAERTEGGSDLVMISELPPLPTIKDRIFNEKLSREFRDRYEQKFGRTDAERIYYSPNRSTYYNDMYYRGSPQELNDERSRFGDYMIKRLAEYHIEDYMKNDPRGKVLYTIKERVQNVGVQVQKFRFDARYEIAGNTFDFVVKNPYITNARIRLQMNSSSFGPGRVEETIYTLGTALTPTVSLETYFIQPFSRLSFVARKALSTSVSTTLSTVSGRRDIGSENGDSENWIRENVYLLGVNYIF